MPFGTPKFDRERNDTNLQFPNSLTRILWDTRSDKADFAAGHDVYWMPVYARQTTVLLDGLILRKVDGMEQDYRRPGKLLCYHVDDQSAGARCSLTSGILSSRSLRKSLGSADAGITSLTKLRECLSKGTPFRKRIFTRSI